MDELDRTLLADDEIVPSSGFSTSVMSAIRTDAAAPSPLPFPWGRAWPGVVAVAITFVALLVTIAGAWRVPNTGSDAPAWLPDVARLGAVTTASSVVWSAVGIGLALAAVSIGSRLANPSSR